jgi:hypothetical protein
MRGVKAMRAKSQRHLWCWILLPACLLVGYGCSRPVPEGGMILTQIPVGTTTKLQPRTLLDQRYPAGSRVALILPPYASAKARVLSGELAAAGEPVVSPDGDRVVFAGRPKSSDTWQIYEVSLGGGPPKAITSFPGGAMDPALDAHRRLIFSSPVPKPGELWKTGEPSALYSQGPDGVPRRLTFGGSSAVEPTVLGDGRILFVSAHSRSGSSEAPELGLFTINNDGTELTAFALDHDGTPYVHRPRELPDGRVVFLSASKAEPDSVTSGEFVRQARPFASRAALFPFPTSRCNHC